MLPEENLKHLISIVQNLRTAQQRFFLMRTSTNLNTAKKWEQLTDQTLSQLKRELNLQDQKDSKQESLF